MRNLLLFIMVVCVCLSANGQSVFDEQNRNQVSLVPKVNAGVVLLDALVYGCVSGDEFSITTLEQRVGGGEWEWLGDSYSEPGSLVVSTRPGISKLGLIGGFSKNHQLRIRFLTNQYGWWDETCQRGRAIYPLYNSEVMILGEGQTEPEFAGFKPVNSLEVVKSGILAFQVKVPDGGVLTLFQEDGVGNPTGVTQVFVPPPKEVDPDGFSTVSVKWDGWDLSSDVLVHVRRSNGYSTFGVLYRKP